VAQRCRRDLVEEVVADDRVILRRQLAAGGGEFVEVCLDQSPPLPRVFLLIGSSTASISQ